MAAKKQVKSSCPEGWLATGISIPLELTKRQQRYARRAAGISRFVYNLAVATHQFCRRNHIQYPSGKDDGKSYTPGAHDMAREFNAVKRTEYPFVAAVSKFVAQGAFRDFDNALKRWRDPEVKSGRPQFKKRKRTGAGGFLAASGIASIRYDGHKRITLPYLGSVKMPRALPDGWIPYEVHITQRNGQCLAGVGCWRPPIPAPDRDTQTVGGVDVGIQPLAVAADNNADGIVWLNPKAYYATLQQRRRWQRAQARRTPGSRGWHEAQRRLDQLNRRSNGLRQNLHHHISKTLVTRYHTLGIETLNVRGMIAAGIQAKALSDAAMSGLLGKIRYKAELYGARLVTASQWYASSKTCSECGAINHDLGRQPVWSCPTCGVIHDRNRNAARNLLKLTLGAVGVDVTLPDGQALAAGVSPAVKPTRMKGEPEPKHGYNQQLALAL